MPANRAEVGYQQYEVFEQDVSMALLVWMMLLAICMLQPQGHLVQVHKCQAGTLVATFAHSAESLAVPLDLQVAA